jgi:hypothetical protein
MNNEINDGGPAFPAPATFERKGMSLRDYFASAALQGMLVKEGGGFQEWAPEIAERYAREAYFLADRMLDEREKR